jgi:hypothetical protein
MESKEVGFRLPSVSDEFAAACFEDKRLERRLGTIVERVSRQPSASLPEALGTVADLEAGYRFLRSDRVRPQQILQPHIIATWKRAKSSLTVLSIEDTTEVRFGGASLRPGLGHLMNGGHGFYLHAAMLVSFDKVVVPLGLPHHEILVRETPSPRKSANAKGSRWRKAYSDPNKESLRWNRVAAEVDSQAAKHNVRVIHVGDREADDFALLSEQIARNSGFVIRLRADRKVNSADGAGDLLSLVLSAATGCLEREVPLSERHPKRGSGSRRKTNRPRQPRLARLQFRAARVQIRPPQHLKGLLPLDVNVVEVREVNPPAGAEEILWRLLTTEAIDTVEQIERVVDIYRARWLIEELWKAVKTSCAFEERQLESRRTLENALAIYLPIAWHMLLVRTIARDAPETPAHQVVSARQLALLKLLAQSPSAHFDIRLAEHPAAEHVLLAIARLGGHLSQNGSPGWLVLRRGFDKLLQLELLFDTLNQAVSLQRSDQS